MKILIFLKEHLELNDLLTNVLWAIGGLVLKVLWDKFQKQKETDKYKLKKLCKKIKKGEDMRASDYRYLVSFPEEKLNDTHKDFIRKFNEDFQREMIRIEPVLKKQRAIISHTIDKFINKK